MQPALYEAFGLTVVEAMSCGLPVFATICGGPAEASHPPFPAHLPLHRAFNASFPPKGVLKEEKSALVLC